MNTVLFGNATIGFSEKYFSSYSCVFAKHHYVYSSHHSLCERPYVCVCVSMCVFAR